MAFAPERPGAFTPIEYLLHIDKFLGFNELYRNYACHKPLLTGDKFTANQTCTATLVMLNKITIVNIQKVRHTLLAS